MSKAWDYDDDDDDDDDNECDDIIPTAAQDARKRPAGRQAGSKSGDMRREGVKTC